MTTLKHTIHRTYVLRIEFMQIGFYKRLAMLEHTTHILAVSSLDVLQEFNVLKRSTMKEHLEHTINVLLFTITGNT